MKPSSTLRFVVVSLMVVIGWLVTSPPLVKAGGIWYVSNSGNDINDCATPTTPCASINATLNKPGFIAGDVVRVAVGMYKGSGTEVTLLNKSVILSGGWDTAFTSQSGMTTIDGEGARRGIMVTDIVTGTIERFTVQNGFSTSMGGGLYVYASNLSILQSNVIQNLAEQGGGGIFNQGSTLRIDDGSIAGNTAGLSGYSGNGGGGIYSLNGTLTINRSTINNNYLVPGSSGTGISVGGGSLTINNSTISDNVDGVGIYSVSTNMDLNSSTISHNARGGLFVQFGTVHIRNTIIAHNGMVAGYDCTVPSGYGPGVSSLGYNLIGSNSGCGLANTDLLGMEPIWAPCRTMEG